MQKKLLAVAVAGALTAPAVAMAQSTTSATIYGTISFSAEVRSATGGDTSTASTSSMRTVAGAAGTTQLGATAATSAIAIGGGGLSATPADLASRTTSQGAGSNFGIRVREDLGAGMYSWLQLELSVQAQGVTPISSGSGGTAPTYRNSALALGSNAFGDVLLGIWDSPINVNMNPAPQHAPYSNASTSFSAGLYGGTAFAQATNSAQTLAAMCATDQLNSQQVFTATQTLPAPTTFNSSAQTCLAHAMSFHRRMTNSIQYWSPSWSGFQLKLMYSHDDLKTASNAAPTTDPRAYGGSITYSAGPLYLGAAYEKHKDFTAFAVQTFTTTAGASSLALGGTSGLGASALSGNYAAFRGGATGITSSNDTGWNLNARYTFGAFTVGGYYERLKWSNSYGVAAVGDITDMSRRAYGLEGAFVTGPHTLGLRWAKVKSMDGSVTGLTFNGDSSGATAWMLGYAYSLSKRSSVFAYYTRVNNDTNARYGGIVFNALAPAPGGHPQYVGVGIRHTF